MACEKIKRSQYEKLKSSYLSKNRSLHSLYIELYDECEISRHLFFRLINKIRIEEGLNAYYTPKKKKRKSNVIKNRDKSPHYYNN
ncbi:MAG: hypothetical protein IJL02_12185 [Methanobrevibacter sp.]|uniref:hypothetical protein n=1 Tax=Methanobrevibacter sp. TaxID=66852 RepID=UPI0025F6E1BF|nr:hypothetical protein [Methanobrevibacter sp.]MBQ6100575.1 hypothetical protein [Methanobrevibacter sp.]MBQ6100606.1 hypothetical protein [Methanobrevibacter sp.]